MRNKTFIKFILTFKHIRYIPFKKFRKISSEILPIIVTLTYIIKVILLSNQNISVACCLLKSCHQKNFINITSFPILYTFKEVNIKEVNI